MKLASLKGGRDGHLCVVSRDLTRCVRAASIAPTLQAALDDWERTEPQLRALAEKLESGHADSEPYDPSRCAAPLPRAFQWVDCSAYLNHVELVRKARGAEMPASFRTDPIGYQGGSDDLLGACDEMPFVSEQHGIDLEAEVAVITGDVGMGTAVANAGRCVRLLVLVNDWTLRNLVPGELAKGFGFYQSKPATGFSPVAVTPDELGGAWQDDKAHLPLLSFINDEPLGRPNAGIDMAFSFGDLIAHLAKTRNLRAGTVLGAGTVSNRDASAGCSCLAEKRALETIRYGAPRTPFLSFGDRVRIEMLDAEGRNIFGSIAQRVARARVISAATHPG